MSHEEGAENIPLLGVDRLVKRFGGFSALDGASFNLMPGEVLAQEPVRNAMLVESA